MIIWAKPWISIFNSLSNKPFMLTGFYLCPNGLGLGWWWLSGKQVGSSCNGSFQCLRCNDQNHATYKKTRQSRRSMHTRVPRTSQLIKLWDIWLFLKSLVQTDGMNVAADLLLNQHFSLACPSANFWYTMSLSYPLSKERNWRKSFRLTSSNLLPCWWWLGRRWSRTFKHTHNTCKKSY